MGFNKRKLQDQQRDAVEKEAAARRVISLPKQAADQKLAYKFIYVHWQSGRGAKASCGFQRRQHKWIGIACLTLLAAKHALR